MTLHFGNKYKNESVQFTAYIIARENLIEKQIDNEIRYEKCEWRHVYGKFLILRISKVSKRYVSLWDLHTSEHFFWSCLYVIIRHACVNEWTKDIVSLYNFLDT